MLTDKLPGVAALLLAGLAALLLFPLFGSAFYVQLVAKIMILAVFAMSLNLLVGFTGLVSLGHAAFYGLAAYMLVFLSPEFEAAGFWWTLGAAVLASAGAALVIGVFVLRTTGIYFIMVTLAFAQMLYYLFHDGQFAGGSDGVYIYFKPDATLFGFQPFDLENQQHFYYVALGVMVLAYLLLRVILQSPFGHVVAGIRTNEHRMRSLGYPTFRYKLASFVIAGALAGVSGYLSAAQFGFVNPELMGWHVSGEVLMMVILGGMGSVFGPILGAFSIVLLEELFADLTKHWLLLMGGFIIMTVLVLPHGLSGLLASALSRVGAGRRKPVPETGPPGAAPAAEQGGRQ
ncbi:branched-chain amino acid ABC transporter permease [Arenibaculum sp.]|jgi:branched-chain amino acid transport system permease protein|uniref:branched-chain amino acid ABC transporter permease n=1 Tax=Arenibaculum sp. TaxID=2865862 RepID=UPI002E129F0E|nr:branched-chain amino acid ABC transporter permease [Arenibaculum sp.]